MTVLSQNSAHAITTANVACAASCDTATAMVLLPRSMAAKKAPKKAGKKGGAASQKADKASSKEASDSITSASEDFSQWYGDVIRGADMVDASPVKGCMVIKPWGMSVWDRLRSTLDDRIVASGASNAYFPLLIPRSFLSKEAEHVDGFAKECAVVTHHRLASDPGGSGELIPDPAAELDEPLIIRPTSETMIWHMFQKWIGSHRDLPLKVNQWANVVRWEMRTRPFLRSSEFLWQEGHTAHATRDEAVDCARDMLDVYADVVESTLAVPVVKGCKSAIERFAGADETYTIEALMPNGWALQSGTSHFLGQNFAKAFEVYYQTKDAKRELVWATSWGVSTRLLGALVVTRVGKLRVRGSRCSLERGSGVVISPQSLPEVPTLSEHSHSYRVGQRAHLEVEVEGKGGYCSPMTEFDRSTLEEIQVLVETPHVCPTQVMTHSDDSGLVLPPKIAPVQVVLVPITRKNDDEGTAAVAAAVDAVVDACKANGIRIKVDDRDSVRNGAKYFEWERKGVPLRLECGPRDAAANTLVVSSRIDAEKVTVPNDGALGDALRTMLDDIQAKLYDKALTFQHDKTFLVDTYDDLKQKIADNELGFFQVYWCADDANEKQIKEDCSATIRCYPLDKQVDLDGKTCFYSGRPATHVALFARAF